MAVRTRDEILNSLRERFADDTSDETLGLIEDVSDTINDYESRTSDSTNWKKKYEDNDAEWRKKYKDRFFNASNDKPEEDEVDDEPDKPLRFEDLFKEGE